MSTKGPPVHLFESRPPFVISLVLSFVVIFGLACIVAYKSYTKAIDAAIRSNETKATLLSKLILEHQRAAVGALLSYADRPDLVRKVKERDFEGTLKELTDLAKNNPEMDWPFVASPDSTVWVNYPVDKQVMNRDLSYRDWYRGVSKEWKPYISSVYKLLVGQKDLAVAVSTPIFDEKRKVVGILNTAQSTAFFRKIIAEAGSNLDAKIALVDQEGHIIYSNAFPYTKEIINYPLFESVKRAMRREKGNIELRDVSDQDRIKYVSVAPIEGIGWSIMVEKAKIEVLRSEYSYFVLIGLISLLICGVVVLSLVHLRDRHRQIKELDGRVRERTAELEAGNKAMAGSEERYRLAVQASNDAIWDLNLTEGTVHWNDTYAASFGRPPETQNSWQWWIDHIHPNDRDRAAGGLQAAIDGEANAWVCEYRFLRADGTWADIYDRAFIARDESRKAWRVVGAMQDLTERKQIEKALRESEALLRVVVYDSPDPIFLKDRSSRILLANPATIAIVEKPPEEVIGKTDEEFYDDPEIGRAIMANDRRIMESNRTEVIEETAIGPTGKRIYLSTKTPYRDADGQVVGIIGVARDITERKRAEEIQRRSEARFRLLSETAGRLLATDDPQRIVEDLCRDVMKHLDCHTFFNFLVDESVGRLRLNACAGIPAQEASKIEWLDYGVAVCGCVAQGRARIIAEDIFHVYDPRTDLIKSYGIQAYCCHPLMAQGRLIGTLSFGTRTRQHFTPDEVALMRTVADQVAIAMQRIQVQEALRQHALDLQNLNERLEDRVKQRTAELANLSAQLVSAQENERRRVSYELHDKAWQALVAIRFDIERLFSDRDDWSALQEKSKQVTTAILDTVGKIRSMQGDLWPYVLDDIGVLATIDWYCREFEKDHPNLTIEVQGGVAENEVPPPAKIVIYRILQETLSNIARHSQARHITICLMKKDQGVEFTVQDNGIGFNPEETVAKRVPWGGLGLLSIKARTELSGGTFVLESAKGKGTTVQASWPV